MAEADKKEVKTEEKAEATVKDNKTVETPNATNTTKTSGANSIPEKPYMEMQFEEFLTLIGEANLLNWSIMAEALGVDRSTVTR